MRKDVRPAPLFHRSVTLLASSLALCLALPSLPARADQDYPPGLFENSPVMGPQGAAPPDAGAPPGPMGPGDAEPPVAAAPLPDPYGAPPPGAYGAPPPSPYGAGPSGPYGAPLPGPYGAGPPGPYAGPPVAGSLDDCANMAYRVFSSLAEVRRAHAHCDRLRGPPPPPAGPMFGQ